MTVLKTITRYRSTGKSSLSPWLGEPAGGFYFAGKESSAPGLLSFVAAP